MLRLGYLVPRVVIVAAVWLFFALAFDPLLRWGAARSGQAMTGATIEVDGLQTEFFPPSIAIGRVQLANPSQPMTNLIEFDSFQFKWDGDPLLRKKFVIDEGTLRGLKWGTPRTVSGRLPDRPIVEEDEAAGPGWFDGLGGSAQELGQDWLDELTETAKMQADPNQFESVRLADGAYKDWKARFDEYEDRIKSIQTRVKQLEKTIKNAKGSTIERLQKYDEARRNVKELLAEADEIRRELPDLGNQANDDYRAIDAARQRDLNEIRRKLDLFKLDAETISDALIGPELRSRLAETIDWITWLRRKMAAVSDRPEPERLRGVDVDFSLPNSLPTFLIRQLKLTGEADIRGETVPFQGLVTDVTSDPVLHGKPITLKLHGKNSATVQVQAVFDHTSRTPVYDVAIAYSLPKKTEVQLGKQSKIVLNVAAAQTDWRAKLRLSGDQLSGNLELRQSPVSISLDVKRKTRDDVKRVLEQALAGVSGIEAAIALSGSYKRPQWKVTSNLGEQISSGLNNVLSRELAVKREELAQKVDALTREKMAEFDTMLNEEFNKVVADLNLGEQNAQNLIQRLADRSGLNPGKLGSKLKLDEKRNKLLKKSGLDKALDPKKFDFNKLFD